MVVEWWSVFIVRSGAEKQKQERVNSLAQKNILINSIDPCLSRPSDRFYAIPGLD